MDLASIIFVDISESPTNEAKFILLFLIEEPLCVLVH